MTYYVQFDMTEAQFRDERHRRNLMSVVARGNFAGPVRWRLSWAPNQPREWRVIRLIVTAR